MENVPARDDRVSGTVHESGYNEGESDWGVIDEKCFVECLHVRNMIKIVLLKEHFVYL